MHINAKLLCIQRNLVHRTRKDKKSHGEIRQRTVAEMAMHSHATFRECSFNQESSSDAMCLPHQWSDCVIPRAEEAMGTVLPSTLIFLKHRGRAQDGQSHAPKSSPAYHRSSLYCGKDKKETAIILPPENMSLIFKSNYMHQIQKTKLQFTEMSSPPVNELPQQSRKHNKGKPLKRRQFNSQNLEETWSIEQPRDQHCSLTAHAVRLAHRPSTKVEAETCCALSSRAVYCVVLDRVSALKTNKPLDLNYSFRHIGIEGGR